MERELDSQWRAETKNENLTGHGLFAHGYHKKVSSLDTQHPDFAAREMVLSIGMVSYCDLFFDLASRMASDLEDEVEKVCVTMQHDNRWTGHSPIAQSLNSNREKVLNFKLEGKDLDNQVQSAV